MIVVLMNFKSTMNCTVLLTIHKLKEFVERTKFCMNSDQFHVGPYLFWIWERKSSENKLARSKYFGKFQAVRLIQKRV